MAAIGAVALFVGAGTLCAGAVFLFFGTYWYRLINSQPDPDGPSYTLT